MTANVIIKLDNVSKSDIPKIEADKNVLAVCPNAPDWELIYFDFILENLSIWE